MRCGSGRPGSRSEPGGDSPAGDSVPQNARRKPTVGRVVGGCACLAPAGLLGYGVARLYYIGSVTNAAPTDPAWQEPERYLVLGASCIPVVVLIRVAAAAIDRRRLRSATLTGPARRRGGARGAEERHGC